MITETRHVSKSSVLNYAWKYWAVQQNENELCDIQVHTEGDGALTLLKALADNDSVIPVLTVP